MTHVFQSPWRLAHARRAALACLIPACLMLAGCGASNGLTDKVMRGLVPAAEPVPLQVGKATPMIDVQIPAREAAGAMAQVALRGAVSEWRSADGIGLTLRDGQIIATRGFGPDLLIADSQGAAPALRQGGGAFSRTMHWLDGENHDRAEIFACTLSAQATQPKPNARILSETCKGPQRTFTNTYTVSTTTGALIRSDQWVSPDLGHIRIEPR